LAERLMAARQKAGPAPAVVRLLRMAFPGRAASAVTSGRLAQWRLQWPAVPQSI